MGLNANLIKELRDKTGAGFLDCKKSLEENNNDIEPNITSDKLENISIDQPSNPKDIIEQNTKQLLLEVDNKTLDDLVESNNNEGLSNEVNSGFDLFDLLFIALISLASGILLALIFIYLRNIILFIFWKSPAFIAKK